MKEKREKQRNPRTQQIPKVKLRQEPAAGPGSPPTHLSRELSTTA